jgi:hypothetical protein
MCGIMVRDWLHPPRIKGTISEVGKSFWCKKCDREISGRTTPLIHETNVHLPRDISRSKGHNFCRVKNLWKCNHCYFESRRRNEVKAHLEKEHYFEVHPDKIPKPEASLVGHIAFIEPGIWKCTHCDYKDRRNKVIKHLSDAHKIEIDSM